MSVLPDFLLDSDDDWIEAVRIYLYPKIHSTLKGFGGYSLGRVSDHQKAGRVEVSEEAFEEVLEDLGFIRNPIAALKRNVDGNVSEGSWVLLSEDAPAGLLDDDRQLHLTLVQAEAGGLDLYFHEEYDWRVKPFKHLREVDFSAEHGRRKGQRLLSERTSIKIIQNDN